MVKFLNLTVHDISPLIDLAEISYMAQVWPKVFEKTFEKFLKIQLQPES